MQQPYKLDIITPPAAEPLSTTELRNYCQIDVLDDGERDLINLFGVAGRRQIEHLTGLTLVATTFRMKFDSFPPCGELRLPRRPVTGVTSVTYLDGNGTEQTMPTTSYRFVERELYSSVRFAGTMPTVADQSNAVRITFVAGYADAASVPQELRVALGAWARMNYDNREPIVIGKTIATLPYAFASIISAHSAPEA